jgi:hypothetical protein
MNTELERALTQLRGDYDRVRLERDRLAQWKAEAMAVSASWDVQAVGKLIGAQPGTAICEQIESFLRAVIAERDELKDWKERAKKDISDIVDIWRCE